MGGQVLLSWLTIRLVRNRVPGVGTHGTFQPMLAIQLGSRVPVVDHQGIAPLQAQRHVSDPAGHGGGDFQPGAARQFGQVNALPGEVGGQIQRFHRGRAWTGNVDERVTIPADKDLFQRLTCPAQPVHRQRVCHLVGQHNPGDRAPIVHVNQVAEAHFIHGGQGLGHAMLVHFVEQVTE